MHALNLWCSMDTSKPRHIFREYLRRARATFPMCLPVRGLALTHLPKCPLWRDNPWVPHAGAELRGCDPQRATNDICIAPRLARFGAQSMDSLMEQVGAVVQLSSTPEYHGLGSKPLDKGPLGHRLQLLGQARPLYLRAARAPHQVLPLSVYVKPTSAFSPILLANLHYRQLSSRPCR